MANRVSTLEKARPHTMAVATGPQIKDFPPKPKARDIKPEMVVKLEMQMGTTRLLAA